MKKKRRPYSAYIVVAGTGPPWTFSLFIPPSSPEKKCYNGPGVVWTTGLPEAKGGPTKQPAECARLPFSPEKKGRKSHSFSSVCVKKRATEKVFTVSVHKSFSAQRVL